MFACLCMLGFGLEKKGLGFVPVNVRGTPAYTWFQLLSNGLPGVNTGTTPPPPPTDQPRPPNPIWEYSQSKAAATARPG